MTLSVLSFFSSYILRYLGPLKSGDFQLIVTCRRLREKSLGVIPLKTLLGIDTTPLEESLDSERYSRMIQRAYDEVSAIKGDMFRDSW